MKLVVNASCLNTMKSMKPKSVDLILCDPPYGVTAHEWDVPLPLGDFWRELRRVIKDTGVILIFGVEPFSSSMRCAALDMFKYDYVWVKSRATNFTQAGSMPILEHEVISVFSYGHLGKSETRMKYNPQQETDGYYPTNILEFKSVDINNKLHPCQKPIALLSYLIRSHSDPGDVVLDPTCGSGSTLVSAKDCGRGYIGIEKDEKFYDATIKRLDGIAQERFIGRRGRPKKK